MRTKRYRVTLTADEREDLHDLIAAGKAAGPRSWPTPASCSRPTPPTAGPPGPIERIAEALEVSTATVERVRQRFVEHGLEAALVRKPPDRPPRPTKLDGRAEARLIALACSAAAGRPRAAGRCSCWPTSWSSWRSSTSISDETVRRALKKTSSSRG